MYWKLITLALTEVCEVVAWEDGRKDIAVSSPEAEGRIGRERLRNPNLLFSEHSKTLHCFLLLYTEYPS